MYIHFILASKSLQPLCSGNKQFFDMSDASVHICIFLDFCWSQRCLIKHALIPLELSPARNRLPSVASFLSCDSHTPQIRPGRLMTASQLLLEQTILERRQAAGPLRAARARLLPPVPRCLLDVAKENISAPRFRLGARDVVCRLAARVRLCRLCPAPSAHSSVGRSLLINTTGSFRRITFSRKDWTMVNMSYRHFLLNYPHSSSRQSRRRANKRKRVSGFVLWTLISGVVSGGSGIYELGSWKWTNKRVEPEREKRDERVFNSFIEHFLDSHLFKI